MKQPLILKQPGIQVRLSESPADESLVNVEVASRDMADANDCSVIEVRTLRVLGNEEVKRWLDSE
jgi:hypothetical protein